MTGALLLVAVLALALVIPALNGVRVGGVGTTIQLPAEPHTGDCVLPTPINAAAPADHSPAVGPTFAACAGQAATGEVVAVVTVTDTSAAPVAPDSLPGDGIDCRRTALVRSGAVLADGRPLSVALHPDDRISWDLALNARMAVVAPTPLMRSAGQQWRACVALPMGGERFVGRLAGAFTGGRLPSEFGVCSVGQRPSVVLNPTPCPEPHLAELVATTTVPGGGRTAVTDIENSCRRIAALVVGRTDPTAAGQLSVEASISPAAAQFLATPQPLDVMCYVSSATRLLSGTLIGLGDRPIPFVS